jgi:hypothetical protein
MEESMTINFSNLEKLSKKINEASDDLTKALTSINEKLNSLNLGIETWLEAGWCLKTDYGQENEEGYHVETRWLLGYGKSPQGKWSLLVRAEDWLMPANEDLEGRFTGSTEYPLLSCPRDLRVAAIQYIPQLVEQLEKKSEDFTQAVSKAKELADKL